MTTMSERVKVSSVHFCCEKVINLVQLYSFPGENRDVNIQFSSHIVSMQADQYYFKTLNVKFNVPN